MQHIFIAIPVNENIPSLVGILNGLAIMHELILKYKINPDFYRISAHCRDKKIPYSNTVLEWLIKCR